MNVHNDVKFALRQIAGRPGFTLAVVLTLAIGIGANTAMFSIVNRVLLEPLPYPDADRLMVVNNSYPGLGLAEAGTSIPDYLDRREGVPAFEESALWAATGAGIATGGTPDYFEGLSATRTLFATLGVDPAIGRAFTAEEMQPGKDKVVILSHRLWQRLFAGSPRAVGSDLRIGGVPHRVIGVMPAGFAFPDRDTDYIVPFTFTPEQMSDYGDTFASMLARLAPGATAEQAHAQMQAIFVDLNNRFPDFAKVFGQAGMTTVITDLHTERTADASTPLLLMQLCVGFVLLIVCANIANLFLTRMLARQRELSVRTAMGAGRLRIARQLFTECLLLSLIGGVGGILLAYAGLELIHASGLLQGIASTFEPRVDGSVLLVMLIVALLAGLLFGLFPVAFAWRGHAANVLTEGGRGISDSKRSRHSRNALVVAQVTLAVALLVSAGLLMRSFTALQSVEPGFNETGVLSARISLPDSRYPDPSSARNFQQRLQQALQGLPGARASAMADSVPFGHGGASGTYTIRGKESTAGAPLLHSYRWAASDGYFETMQIALLKGRNFDAGDRTESRRVAIIDEIFARKHFPDSDPIGRQITFAIDVANPPYWTIVGVVDNVKHFSMDEREGTEAIYLPLSQVLRSRFYVVLHTDGNPDALIAPLRDALQRLDPELPTYDIATLHTRIDNSLQHRRTPMTLLAVFAGIALLLAGIGLYGVLAFSVAQRTGEIGVRMAVGADRERIMKLILGQGARLISIGLGLGLVLALLLGFGLRSMLFGVGAADPLVYLSAVSLLAVIAFCACAIPSWRAARVNPVDALRDE